MKLTYLEVTFRKGKLLAANLFLPREVGRKCGQSEKLRDGILIDYAESRRLISIEIINPRQIDMLVVTNVLIKLKSLPVVDGDFIPILTS